MNDDLTPRRLGSWLAQMSGMPFDDRATPAPRAVDFSRLRAELANSGKPGEMAVRLMDFLDRRHIR